MYLCMYWCRQAAAAREVIRDETAEANRLLSVANAQKAGVEELARRSMAQLKSVHEDKLSLQVRYMRYR